MVCLVLYAVFHGKTMLKEQFLQVKNGVQGDEN